MKRFSDLEIGDRFLAEDMSAKKSPLPILLPTEARCLLPELSFFTVTERDDGGFTGVNAAGVTLNLTKEPQAYAFDPARWKITPGGWNLRQLSADEELPTGDDVQIARYCAPRIYTGEARDTKPTFFHIDSVNGAEIRGTIVDRGENTDPGYQGRFGVEWTGETIGAANFYAVPIHLAFEPPLDVAPGDLITSNNFRCDISNAVIPGELVTTLKNAIVIGSFPDRAAVAAFCEPSTSSPPRYSLGISNYFIHFEEFITEETYGRARSEQSEGLVLWWCPSDAKQTETTCQFLGHTGIDFLVCEDGLEDYFHGENIAPGLYIAFNSRIWSDVSHEGEHDSGIEVDWRPASLQDVERFGFTLNTLDAEIADIMEIDARPELATEFMQTATISPEPSYRGMT